jgi:hypothetical protein
MTSPKDGKEGVFISSKEYRVLKPFQDGGSFWDSHSQEIIREQLGDFLPRVYPSRRGSEDGGLFQRFISNKEVLGGSTPVPHGRVPPDELKRLKEATNRLRLAAEAETTQRNNREILASFRLPNPETDPELYRLRGRPWNRKLEILWGCEKREDSSLPPIQASNVLQPDPVYQVKKGFWWFLLVLAIVLGFVLLWLFLDRGLPILKHMMNARPVVVSQVEIVDLPNRIVVLDLSDSYDRDGEIDKFQIAWGDDTVLNVLGADRVHRHQYEIDGRFEIAVVAVDDRDKPSRPNLTTVTLDHAEQLRLEEAERVRLVAEEQARTDAEAAFLAERARRVREAEEERLRAEAGQPNIP